MERARKMGGGDKNCMHPSLASVPNATIFVGLLLTLDILRPHGLLARGADGEDDDLVVADCEQGSIFPVGWIPKRRFLISSGKAGSSQARPHERGKSRRRARDSSNRLFNRSAASGERAARRARRASKSAAADWVIRTRKLVTRRPTGSSVASARRIRRRPRSARRSGRRGRDESPGACRRAPRSSPRFRVSCQRLFHTLPVSNGRFVMRLPERVARVRWGWGRAHIDDRTRAPGD